MPPRSSVPAILGLFVASLALRPQLLAIGPLLPIIRMDLGLAHGVAGLLGSIPVLCMGLFAPLGPVVAARFGVRWALAGCLGLVGVFGVVRALAPDAAGVLGSTVAIGIAVGTAGAIPAIVVKLKAPTVPALGTGAYAGGIVAGSSIAAALAIPLAGPALDWRHSLAVLSVAGLVPAVAWLLLVRPDGAGQRASAAAPRLPWRSRTGWLLVAAFGIQSLVYYGLVSWLPNVYVERGWDEAPAGALVAVMNAVGLVTTIGVPLVADRIGSRRGQLVVASAAAVAGLLGVILVPDLGLAWAAVLGLALGAIFPLVLTLPVDVADSPGDVGATAALMLLGGYVLSSTGPVLLGAVRDATGDFGTSLWVLAVLAVGEVATCAALSPVRLRRGIRRRETSPA